MQANLYYDKDIMVNKPPSFSYMMRRLLIFRRVPVLGPELLTPLLPLYMLGTLFLTANAPALSVLLLAVLLVITSLIVRQRIRHYPEGFGASVRTGYLPFLIQSFFLLAALWHWQVEDVYYYCADRAPILDFFPPFVHARDVDYYVASEPLVYRLWYSFWATILLLPLMLCWLCRPLNGTNAGSTAERQ